MMNAAWCEYVDLSTFSRCTENMRLIFFSLFLLLLHGGLNSDDEVQPLNDEVHYERKM